MRKLVVYSWNLQERLTATTMQRGVSGYLSKSLTGVRADRARCRRWPAARRSSPPTPAAPRSIGGDWPGREEGLTAREAEVLALITQGLSNADIATRTSLSINSIKSYIRSCYRKIGVSSRARAVLWGATHGFLPDRHRAPGPDRASTSG